MEGAEGIYRFLGRVYRFATRNVPYGNAPETAIAKCSASFIRR